jgi:UDP-N-acetylglucosamine pyrophosphorylase
LFILKDVQTDFEGFEQLFSRYLLESVDQASIDWQEIQPPPEHTVSSSKMFI